MLIEIAGVEPPAPSKRTIDMEGRVIKNAVRKTLQERQTALMDLVDAIRGHLSSADKLVTLLGSEYAQAVQELNKAIDRGEGLLQ